MDDVVLRIVNGARYHFNRWNQEFSFTRKRERRASCAGHLDADKEIDSCLAVLVLFDDGNSIKDFPHKITLKDTDNKIREFNLQLISVKSNTKDRLHYSSFMKHGETHWTFFDQLLSGNTIRNFYNLPNDLEQYISLLIYVCF